MTNERLQELYKQDYAVDYKSKEANRWTRCLAWEPKDATDLGEEIRLATKELESSTFIQSGASRKYYIEESKTTKIQKLKQQALNLAEQIAKLEEPELKDKQLVWCWDKFQTHQRIVGFYDAINDRPFTNRGRRKGISWENYEAFQGEYPDWAKEAYKTLEE